MTSAKFHIVHIVPLAGTRSIMHGLLGYREVVDTIAWGLGQLGHDVSIGENEFRGGCTNILLGAQMLAAADLQRLPESTIVYNFEQIGGLDFEALKPEIRTVADRFRIWDYSESNLATWKSIGARREAVCVPVGWAPVLERIAPAPVQDIDTLLYGIPGSLRMEVFSELCHKGIKAVFACGFYGRARDELIARSKIVLNINQHRSRIFEVVRVSYLLANGKAVVADRQPETFVERDLEAAVAFCSPRGVVAECERLLDDAPTRHALENRGRQCIKARVVTPYLSAGLSQLAIA